jgi:OPT family oligopeptide transporter
VAITACILAYAISNAMHKAGLARTSLTILETNCMQSTASAAGYSTGSTMVSAIPAMLILTVTAANPGGRHLPWPVLAGWTFLLALLGVALAIPMKRNMINQEKLKFPTGTAAALTLQSLYSQGSEAIKKARALMYSALAGALFPLVIDLNLLSTKVGDQVTRFSKPLLPNFSAIFDFLPARGTQLVADKLVANKPSDWTMVLDHNPVLMAAGMIVGMRVATYMVLSAIALAYVLGPEAYLAVWNSPDGPLRAVTSPGTAWKEIGIWFGVPIMVSSGLLLFALQWKTIVRAFASFLGGRGTQRDDEAVQKVEVPMSWFLWGTAASGMGVIWLAHAYFSVPWHYGVLAVLLTFFLSIVACRATGESDITPVGAMGKITQLTYGVLIPQSMTANLMTASITASSAGSAADLLTDLKSGYLLGANPRRQFIAQFFGIFSGTFATVLGFYILVPSATKLIGTAGEVPEYPAPSAQAWKAVAELFQHGLENMHPMHQQAIFWGLLLGVALVLLEKVLPRLRAWLPSATGIGLGMILPFQYPLAMFLGALIAYLWNKRDAKHADIYLVPVAAGVIAGISIVGVLVAVLNNFVLVQ